MGLTGERKVAGGTTVASLPLVEEEEEEGRLGEEGLGDSVAAPGGGPVVEIAMVGVFRLSAKK